MAIADPDNPGTVWPGCASGSCTSWGAAKAVDRIFAGIKSLVVTKDGENPYVQLKMNSFFNSSVTAVR